MIFLEPETKHSQRNQVINNICETLALEINNYWTFDIGVPKRMADAFLLCSSGLGMSACPPWNRIKPPIAAYKI